MGDSASQLPGDSKSSLQSDGPVVQATQGSLREEGNVRSSPQSVSQMGYAYSQQYAPLYQPPHARSDPFNLNQISTALPDSSYQNYGLLPPRYPPAAGTSGLVYPTQNSPQYATPQSINPTNAPYPYQAPFQGGYVAGNPPPVMGIGNQFYHQGYIGRPPQHGSQYIIQPNQFSLQNPVFPATQQPAQYGSRNSVSEESRSTLQQRTSGGQGISDNMGKPKRHNHYQWRFHLLSDVNIAL